MAEIGLNGDGMPEIINRRPQQCPTCGCFPRHTYVAQVRDLEAEVQVLKIRLEEMARLVAGQEAEDLASKPRE